MEHERTRHDLTHYTAQCGQVGRLQTLTYFNCLPGDGAELDIVGSMQMSPLRRGISLDPRVEVCAFFVPYRHIYDDDWISFIEEGADETVDLTTVNVPEEISFCGHRFLGTAPLWLTEGYQQIWNEYFRPPASVPRRTGFSLTADERLFGYECANLKRVWSTGVPDTIDAADFDVPVAGGTVSLLDISRQKGVLKTERERQFFNVRYRDIIKNAGGYVQTSADNRPTLLRHSSFWASGFDVDGTTEASLGNHTGRVSQAFRFRMPRWHVPEHGVLWVVALVRYPPINRFESPYFANNPNPSYTEFAGDPDIFMREPPQQVLASDYFDSGGGATLGQMPFGQFYRTQSHFVHRQYGTLQGFPFLDNAPTGIVNAALVESADYANMFKTTQLGHWNVQANVNAPFLRRLPSARSSIVAGSN